MVFDPYMYIYLVLQINSNLTVFGPWNEGLSLDEYDGYNEGLCLGKNDNWYVDKSNFMIERNGSLIIAYLDVGLDVGLADGAAVGLSVGL